MSTRRSRLDRDIAQALSSGEEITVTHERAGADPLEVVTRAVARIGPPGRFGDRKVFISALHDRVGRATGMDLPSFKRWLIDQHRASRLVLTRADYVAAMDPDLVATSEAKTSGATFHFVVDPTAGREAESTERRPDDPAAAVPARRANARRLLEDLVASGSTSSREWADVAALLRAEASQAPDAFRTALLDRAKLAEGKAAKYRQR